MREVQDLCGLMRQPKQSVSGFIQHAMLCACFYRERLRESFRRQVGQAHQSCLAYFGVSPAYNISMCWVQYRSLLFSYLRSIWDIIDVNVDKSARWPMAAEELLLLCMGLPLSLIDFRAPLSSLINCSDASEQGAGLVVSLHPSVKGEEDLMRRLTATPG